ncbi:hypothetical protein Pd630_LPD04806 [Rhodococcus opacus PD630]|nr:hypothetical protein Pd630_LPD04806 [Rhodococcus opacus PD630]
MLQQLLVQHIGAHAPLHRGIRLVGKLVGQTSPGVIAHHTKIVPRSPRRSAGRQRGDSFQRIFTIRTIPFPSPFGDSVRMDPTTRVAAPSLRYRADTETVRRSPINTRVRPR